MGKRSGYLARIEEQKRRESLATLRFTRQLMIDMSMIALNREFGLGAERLKRFADAVAELYGEYADMWNEDTKDTEYSRQKLDDKLKQICGDYFVPWEERYSS